ncbi:hypothetical protein UFOVP61_52 [uncultured Caudovirales phage]|uniref:Uncharacterized protein n=1 Tax=uncultured Caudovirales phage TaxID=2100421 RepID=A0A6J5KVH4_9CAUD|nr:hypothetical protein UFOVP61_52 [uncultured Caudovirales phage]
MAIMNIKGDDAAMPADYDCCPVIYLSDDQVEALGITSPPAPGKVYNLQVVAVATSVTASMEGADEKAEEGSAPDVRLTLKLTDITVTDSGKSIADTLYQD